MALVGLIGELERTVSIIIYYIGMEHLLSETGNRRETSLCGKFTTPSTRNNHFCNRNATTMKRCRFLADTKSRESGNIRDKRTANKENAFIFLHSPNMKWFVNSVDYWVDPSSRKNNMNTVLVMTVVGSLFDKKNILRVILLY
jgi:hypothetical protein